MRLRRGGGGFLASVRGKAATAEPGSGVRLQVQEAADHGGLQVDLCRLSQVVVARVRWPRRGNVLESQMGRVLMRGAADVAGDPMCGFRWFVMQWHSDGVCTDVIAVARGGEMRSSGREPGAERIMVDWGLSGAQPWR